MTNISLRRGTADQWTAANPVLSSGEPGYETSTGKFKIGDGTTHWIDLPYETGSAPDGGLTTDEVIQLILDTSVSADTLELTRTDLITEMANRDDDMANRILALLGRPPVTTGVTVVVSGTSTLVAWDQLDPSTPADGWFVYRNSALVSDQAASDVDFADSNLTPDTTYTYDIASYKISGGVKLESLRTSTVAYIEPVASTKPDQVLNFGVTSKTDHAINLGWDAVPNVPGFPTQGYRIRKNGSPDILVQTSGLTYSDTTLAVGETASYQIWAYNANGEGVASDIITDTTTTNLRGIRGVFASPAQSGSIGTVSAQLPNVQDGDAGLMLVGTNTGTVAMTTPPVDWELQDEFTPSNLNQMHLWIYRKSMLATDSGNTVSAVLNNNGRPFMAGIVMAGSLYVPSAIVQFSDADGTPDATFALPGILPGSSDNTIVALTLHRFNNLGSHVVNFPTNVSWVKQLERFSTHTTTPQMGVSVGTYQQGGSPTQIAAGVGSYETGSQSADAGWLVAIAPNVDRPTAPTIKTISKSNTSVNLKASGVTAPTSAPVLGYKWYRDGTLITGQTTDTLLDSGLQPNTSYAYTSRAYSAAGDGAVSASLSVKTTQTTTARFPGDPGVGNIYLGGTSDNYTDEQFDAQIFGTNPTKRFVLRRQYNGPDFNFSSGRKADMKAAATAGRISLATWKLQPYSLQDIVDGKADADIDAKADFFATLAKPVMVAFFHEPRDNFTTVAQQKLYRQAYRYQITRSNARPGAAAKMCWIQIVHGNDYDTELPFHPNRNDANDAWLTNGPFTDGSWIHLNGFDRYNPGANPKWSTTTRQTTWDVSMAPLRAFYKAHPSQKRPYVIGEYGVYTPGSGSVPTTLDANGVTAQTIYNGMVTTGVTSDLCVGVILWNSQDMRFDATGDPGSVRRTALKNVINNNSNVIMLTG